MKGYAICELSADTLRGRINFFRPSVHVFHYTHKMKASFKRRSAFGVYQSQLQKNEELLQKEEEKPAKTPGAKKRRHEENSTSRASKKLSKLDSKSLNSELDTNGNIDHEDHSPDVVEAKQKGKGKMLSKANKLRQSLTLSSRKKKRHGYRSYDRELEKSASNVTVHSLPEKGERKTDSDSGNGDGDQLTQVNLERGETEADRLFSWLISPVKPGKFFRCLCVYMYLFEGLSVLKTH